MKMDVGWGVIICVALICGAARAPTKRRLCLMLWDWFDPASQGDGTEAAG